MNLNKLYQRYGLPGKYGDVFEEVQRKLFRFRKYKDSS